MRILLAILVLAGFACARRARNPQTPPPISATELLGTLEDWLAPPERRDAPVDPLARFKRVRPGARWMSRAVRQPAGSSDPKTACESGHAEACFLLGVFYERGQGVDADRSRAIELYESACGAGVPVACYNAGVLRDDEAGDDAAHLSALALFERACVEGHPAGCGAIARKFELGKGVDRDVVAAAGLYARACGVDDLQSCNNVAYILRESAAQRNKSFAPDVERLYRKACFGGYTAACARLGYSEALGCFDGRRPCRPGPADSKDFETLAGLVERECEAGRSRWSCTAYAVHLEAGAGVDADPETAFATFEPSCEDGDAWACNQAANYYRRGVVVDKDPARAEALYDQACKGDFHLSCADLGTLLINRGDANEGLPLLRRACRMDAGSPTCRSLMLLCAFGVQPRACDPIRPEETSANDAL